MKTNRSVFPLFLAALCVGSMRAAYAQNTDGKVTYTVTTANYAGNYAPNNVSAVWVVDGSGKFVKTLCRHAAVRMAYLYKWAADRGTYTAVDGVTSATLSAQPQTHTVKWDCRGTTGQVVPDGTYTFRAEYTSNNGQGPYMGSLCQFVKGASAVTTTFPNFSNAGGQFSGLSLTYTPYNEVAVTGLTPSSGALDASVPVVVTLTNQTLNTLSFSVAVTNATTGALIGSLPVAALPGRAVTNVTFAWNTAGLTASAYQLQAVASKLATETNVANNALTRSVTLSSPTAGDIAVTGLAPTAGAVNSTVSVRVAVTNKTASATGPFTVALLDPLMSQQSVSLAAFAGAVVTFSWSTAGLVAGDYQVRAQAWPLASETATADNALTGTITLRAVLHDVAVRSVAVASMVPPNVITNVLVTVANLGDAAEAFTLTLKDITATPITIGSRVVSSLSAGAGTNLVVAWNTATNAAFKLGYHTLQAEIAPVAGESETANNSFTLPVIVSPGLTTNTLVAAGAVWKYMDKGRDLSAAPWQTSDYYDGLWASGAAPLGYGLASIATAIDTGSAPGSRCLTTYFRHAFNVDFIPLSVTCRVQRAHGVVLYLNGAEIARQNMPAGNVTYGTLAAAAAAGADAATFFGVALDPARLAVGYNLLTAELHLSAADDTVAGFALELASVTPTIRREPRVAPVAVVPEGAAQSGDPFGIFVELVNSGNVATSCLVLLRDAASGAVVASQTVGVLVPGETTSVRVTWPTFGAATGSHTLQALTVINGVTNLANVASASATVDALDFTPRKVAADGSVGGRCSAVAASGRYVYLGCGSSLEVWDAAVPAAPVRLGVLRLPGIVEDLAVSGSWAYAATGAAGVQIVDVSAPAQPRHRATFDTSDFARRVTLDGSLLYVADSLGGVRVLNVASPAAPALAGAYQTTGPAQTVAAVPPHLLVLDAQCGLQVLAAGNPAALTVSGAWSQLTAGLALTAVSGGVLATDANGWLYRISTSAPAAPSLLSSTLLPAAGRGLAASGSALYVAAGAQGLLTLDATTLALQSTTAVGDEAYDVAVAGDTLYVAAGFAGCRSLSIAAPLAPSLLATYATGSRSVDAAAAGSTLYVAGDEAGLQVYNLGNVALPELLGSVSSVSNSRCIEVAYPLAYVGDGLYGLKIFSLTNGVLPMLIGSYSASGLSHIRRLALSGTRLVLTDGRSIQLVSVANPASPAHLATVANTPGSFVFDLAAVGNQAYAACGNAGLRIYGLDNSLNVDNVYATPGPATGVASASNQLHVTCGPYGWQTLSIAANPVSPVLVKSSASGKAFHVAASGSYLYLADGARTGQALKNSLTSTNYLNLTQALRVRAAGGLMLVAEDEAGLAILYPKWAPDAPAGQRATIGSAFEMALPEAFALAVRVTVTGLPSGLRYSATTRLITGVPSKAGVYTVKISAAGVPTQTVTITVEALPAWAWGSFSGFIDGGGVATMSVTSQGNVTGKLVYKGATYSFSATAYAAGGSADGGFSLTASAKAGQVALPVSLLVGHPAGSAPASLGVAEGELGGDVRLVMYRDVWKEVASLLAPYVGYYTASLPGNAGYGSGYLTLTIDAAGKVKAVGKLADGTALSLSGTLVLDPDGRVFAVVYAVPSAYKGGHLFGFVEFVKEEGSAVFLRLVSETPLQWQSLNPAATSDYGAGFSRELGLVGGWYDKVGNLYDYYRGWALTVGTDGAAPTPELTVGDERYESVVWRPDGVSLTVVTNRLGVMTGIAASKVVVSPKAAAARDDDEEDDDDDDDDEAPQSVELSIALTRATGVFSGSFKAWFDYTEKPTYKSVRYEGVLTPVREDLSDGVGGRGFFLWADTGTYRNSSGRSVAYGFSWSYDLKILLSQPEP